MTKTIHVTLGPAATWPLDSLRRAVAWALHKTVAILDRWAHSLQRSGEGRPPARPAMLEFYAEAGAPEGALYVDGVRIGVIEGVTRL